MMDIHNSIQIKRITCQILSVLIVQLLRCPDVHASSSVAPPATTTTDPATTTGTVFTMAVTAAQSSDVKFADPVVYGPVAGGAALLVIGGGIALAVALKKGLLFGASSAVGAAGAGPMYGGTGVAPQSTAMQHAPKTKVTRTKVQPIKVKPMNERPPNISRIEKPSLSIHSIGASRV